MNAFPRLIFLAAVCRAICTCGAEPVAPAPVAEAVAPGVWRIRLGNPEQFTPTYFRSAAMATAGLQAMAINAPLPLDLAKISFQATVRGCTLRLPMTEHESIYGFGLHTKIFDAGGEGQPGRRISIEPTDAPENELGQSHAPVPFYVSTAGYSVFVDTARFASFYTGNLAPEQDGAEIKAGGTGTGTATSTTELYRAREQRGKTMVVDVPAAHGVDVYVFAGPAMLEAVRVKTYQVAQSDSAMKAVTNLILSRFVMASGRKVGQDGKTLQWENSR